MAKVILSDILSDYASRQKLNTNFDAISDAVDNTLSRDGTSPNSMSAELDMNSHNILNLPAPTAPTHPVRLQDLDGVDVDVLVSAVVGQVASVADLKAFTMLSGYNNQLIYVRGHTSTADGGEGFFRVTTSSPGADDNGTLIHSNTAGYYFVRQYPKGQVSVRYFGATGNGVTNDTTALQAALTHAANVMIVPDGTYIFTTLTVPASKMIFGLNQNTSILSTSGTGSAVTIGGHYVHLENIKIAKTGGQAGKGIVAADKYWLTTRRLWVDGFDYDTYFSKSIYHSHYDSRFTDSNYPLHYWGAAGSWNVDWYNNQIVLSNVIAHGDTVGFYFKGVGLSGSIDAAGTTAIQITGESTSFLAHTISLTQIYAENPDTVLDLDYAKVSIDTAFVSGGPNTGARANTPFDLSNSSLIISGFIDGQNYWDYRYILANSSRLEIAQQIAPGADFTTTSVDATSEAYTNDYEEGSFTGTLTGCTTSPTGTIKYTRDGDQVSLYVTADIQGTSNTTAGSITGIPAAIQPGNTQRFNCMVKENSANAAGYAVLSAGTMTIYPSIAFGNFTASGTKGVIGEQVLTYTRK